MSSDTSLFDFDPMTGTTELFHWDAETETFAIETIQEVDDLVERNLAARNETDKHTRWKDINWVASIPNNVFYDLKRRGIGDREDKANGYPKLRRWLDDSENSAFRMRVGRLG